MIKANEMMEQREFLDASDYDEIDLLSRDDICAYQFDVNEHQKTNVKRLPCGDYGLKKSGVIKLSCNLPEHCKMY